MSNGRFTGLAIGAGIAGLIGFWLLSGAGRAEGEAPAGDEEAPADSSLPERTRTPFQPYAADPDALTYESLSETPIPSLAVDPEAPVDEETYRILANETKASVDEAEEWAQTKNGYEVHQRWSAYSQLRIQQIAVERAEREAGLAGIGEVGVE